MIVRAKRGSGYQPQEDNMTIAIYAEHTHLAGRRCLDDDMIERRSDDIVIYEDTPEELYALAIVYNQSASLYLRRVANTLCEGGAHI